ncbi:lipid II flippase Amj family protein [Novosphingobium mangrovi (ex Hu et al. 2023)]|uniref:Lipid II flippase Amj n=1 Tax=Novosphingobium mangrovi (ex Hu et al. 2023) TaxID=2930094 RepID=A0ABT0AGY0_9SPHN|nr:lipid II flippase Amj family protein [Novosphingobium mangrovi (ex Hu et al. 2023)]MCJ1962454.1 lipid II flippase Amj family protein [Novosphingobium mangrovi (ex Hu et al. 2023)]
MDLQLLTICLLTFAINFVGALAYAARIAGVRTQRIALAFALFNVLVLLSRLSNGFLGPFLAKRIESALLADSGDGLLFDFRLVLAAATAASVLGTLFIPTAQRWFSRAIGDFQRHRSVLTLVKVAASPRGLAFLWRAGTPPRAAHLRGLCGLNGVGFPVIALNVLAQALLGVGVLASLYAGYLVPEYRVTASQLSAIVNGFATILLFVLIDPQLSVMTDDVVSGSVGEGVFRRTVVLLALSRVCGTVLAQVLFVPAAWLVVACAHLM